MFTGATTKFSIGSLDDVELEVDAQFNPKELVFDQSITWSDATNTHGQSKNSIQEFGGPNPETVKVDLLFDGYEGEGKLNAYAGNDTVQDQIKRLRDMATVQSANDPKRKDRRPHICVATWGAGKDAMPRFECVIESITVKYQAFANNGTVLRATVTLGLKGCERPATLTEQDAADQRRFIRMSALAQANKRRADDESSSYRERGLQWRGQNRLAEHPEQTETFTSEDNSFADREKVASKRQEEAAKREADARKAGRGRPELKPY